MPFQRDLLARDIALNRFGLPPCLLVPVAAVDLAAIETCIGTATRVISSRNRTNAVLIEAYPPALPDMRLPIWQLPTAPVLH